MTHFQASLIERVRLTKPEAAKETFHLVVDVQDSSFSYQVGDSLAVHAENDLHEVEALLRFFQVPSKYVVKNPWTNSEVDAFSFFLSTVDLAKVPLKLVRAVEKMPSFTHHESLQKAVEIHSSKGSLLVPLMLFLKHFWCDELSFDVLLSHLHQLHPRYYSIASSPKKHPRRADLVVAKVHHEVLGETRKGICSTYLTERAPLCTPSLRVSVQEASHFRLPTDEHAPLIMIGPGTGVAPFRAFLEEIEHARSYFPPCWLFFGSRSRSSDFLYESFFLEHQKKHNLVLNLAFSRDCPDKEYVQHKMWHERVKLASWIDSQGAYVYVCGNAKHMAKDVEETLIRVFLDQNIAKSQEDAHAYLASMRKSGRYCRDVY